MPPVARTIALLRNTTNSGVLPGVARDLPGLADAAGREDDRAAAEHDEPAGLAKVAERAGDAPAHDEELHDRAFHVHIDAGVDALVLEHADHLEAGAIADVGQAAVGVP